MSKKIDYKKIKSEYMTSGKSLGEIAIEQGVSRAQVYKVAKQEGWEGKREAKRQKQTDSLIEKTLNEQSDAWEETKTSMLRILKKKIEILENTPEKSDMTYGQLAHSIKEMRDAGMFGATPSEKKIYAEIEKLKKDVADDGSRDVTIKVITEEVEDYGN